MDNIDSSNREKLQEQLRLNEEEIQAIKFRADLRRKRQNFKFDVINLDQPGSTEAMKKVYARNLETVLAEADGKEILPKDLPNNFLEAAQDALRRAREAEEIFPNLAALHYARQAKFLDIAGEDYREAYKMAQEFIKNSAHIPKIVPNSLLADSILMGIQTRKIEALSLPSIESIAEASLKDESLLKDYALVLSEKERDKFLSLVPESEKLRVSRILDASVASVLHQSLVDKDGEESKQRSKVRARLYVELKNVVGEGKASEKQIARFLANAIGQLGEDTRQLMLDVIRDEYEERSQEEGPVSKKDFLPRVVKVFLDNFDDWRGNDIVLQLAGDKNVNKHLSFYLFGKLIDNGYLPRDIREWWSDRKAVAKRDGKQPEDEMYRMDVLKGVVSRLGVIPSREILAFIANDEDWSGLDLDGRFRKIKESQEEFSGFTNAHDLGKFLNEDSQKAMTYYLLNGGKDRFNLINSYTFKQFKEMLELSSQLQVHEGPINQFKNSLIQGGLSEKSADEIVQRLRDGRFPLENSSQATQEVSFDVSENVAVKNANLEIGQIMGRGQLGVILLFPIYREYLQKIGTDKSQKLLSEMGAAQTLNDRLNLIEKIQEAYPELQTQAIEELSPSWEKIIQKMALELSLNQVFNEDALPVKAEELIPKLDARRIDLQKMKKDLIVGIKGGNQQLKKVQGLIYKKKKTLGAMRTSLEKVEEGSDPAITLKKRIEDIERELQELEAKKEEIGEQNTMKKYDNLSPEAKKEEIEKLGEEILRLTEKSPSAILMYLLMQTIGEERLTENDVNLIQEVESHMQGPFQLIQDSLTYQKPEQKKEKKRMKVRLAYVDKLERFMLMQRFADSKICCFSSNNYTMTVQHGVQNKHWVASMLADPLSYVVAIELPSTDETQEVKDNIGFILGGFGVDEEGNLGQMYNGIYYAPGIEGSEQIEAMFGGIEKIFAGLPVKYDVIASQHGGSVSGMPEGFSNNPIELTRLRAIDDGYGQPESKIYDDLGTGSDLNSSHQYSGNVWHRDRAQSVNIL